MSEWLHTEPGARLYTLGHIASQSSLPLDVVERAVEALKLEPATYLDDVPHYSADAPGRIALWWGQNHRDPDVEVAATSAASAATLDEAHRHIEAALRVVSLRHAACIGRIELGLSARLTKVAGALAKAGMGLRRFQQGGGLNATYVGQPPADLAE